MATQIRETIWPDAEEAADAPLPYDPRDPDSVQAAREALRDRLGLDYLPVLCSEPPRRRRVVRTLRQSISRLLGRG